MANEEKSVRKTVQEIEKRTGKLDEAIEKLSDSLDKISQSLAKSKEDEPGREELIKKFKDPFASPTSVVKENGSEDILDDIKDALVFNQKENFTLFKSIDDTLKKIEMKGGAIGGGGFGDMFDRDKKGKQPKGKAAASSASKVTGEAAEKGAKKGAAKTAASALGKAARFIPGVGLAVAGGMAASDAISAGMNAEETLGITDRKATLGETLSAGAGGLVSGLSMGLISSEKAGKGIESARQGIMGLFSGGGKKEPVSTSGAVASANIKGATPDFKYIEEQRKKIEAGSVKPTTETGSVKPVLTSEQTGTEPSVKPAPKAQPAAAAPAAVATSTVTGETAAPTINKRAAEAESSPLGALQFLKSIGILPKGQGGKDGFVSYQDDQPISKEEVAKKITAAGKDPNKVLQLLSEVGGPGPKVDVSSGDFNKTTDGAFTGVSPPSTSIEPAKNVSQLSRENADMRSEGQAVQPVIMNNTQTVNSNTQTVAPLRVGARPTNNAFERKQNMVASY